MEAKKKEIYLQDYELGFMESLEKGKYKGFFYNIISYGSHPCIYVEIPKDCELFNRHYSTFDLDVHGGVTYSQATLRKNSRGYLTWWLGWDYAHGGSDFISLNTCSDIPGKKWTTEELKQEAISAIDKIVNKEYNLY